MKRVDPEALFGFILNRWGHAVAAHVCPEVADPYDYRADWTRPACPERPAEPVCVGPGPDNYGEGFGDNDTWVGPYPAEPVSDRCDCAMFGFTHTRMECGEYRDKPTEPVIDEAAYEVGREARRNHFDGKGLTVVMSTLDEEAEKAAITAAIIKDRELRSESCGGSSERSSASFMSSSGGQSGPTTETSAAAPAADPRLTEGELWDAQEGTATLCAALRAVADAQLAKAGVTISEAEIAGAVDYHASVNLVSAFVALLRRHRVEVTQ